tara:strand:- start:419 stop:829 length:411 start_codon:yes stop_codon:yes gene_type:complete
MKRILCFDYGEKKTGIAVSDKSHIIASPFGTISTVDILSFIKKFLDKEQIYCFVIGLPKNLDNSDLVVTKKVYLFSDKIRAKFAKIPIYFEDERYTSKMAKQVILNSGVSKSKRRNKDNIDKISACLILQSFLAKR